MSALDMRFFMAYYHLPELVPVTSWHHYIPTPCKWSYTIVAVKYYAAAILSYMLTFENEQCQPYQ